MARGYPDYFGFSMFPYYGDLLSQVPLVPTVFAGDTTTIFELAHKGIIIGGDIYLASPTFPAPATLIVTVDGSITFAQSIDWMYRRNHSTIGSVMLSLSALTIDDSSAVLEFARQVTFSTQFQVQLMAGLADDVDVLGRLNYTAIVT